MPVPPFFYLVCVCNKLSLKHSPLLHRSFLQPCTLLLLLLHIDFDCRVITVNIACNWYAERSLLFDPAIPMDITLIRICNFEENALFVLFTVPDLQKKTSSIRLPRSACNPHGVKPHPGRLTVKNLDALEGDIVFGCKCDGSNRLNCNLQKQVSNCMSLRHATLTLFYIDLMRSGSVSLVHIKLACSKHIFSPSFLHAGPAKHWTRCL